MMIALLTSTTTPLYPQSTPAPSRAHHAVLHFRVASLLLFLLLSEGGDGLLGRVVKV